MKCNLTFLQEKVCQIFFVENPLKIIFFTEFQGNNLRVNTHYKIPVYPGTNIKFVSAFASAMSCLYTFQHGTLHDVCFFFNALVARKGKESTGSLCFNLNNLETFLIVRFRFLPYSRTVVDTYAIYLIFFISSLKSSCP